jgi:hypothetical protein
MEMDVKGGYRHHNRQRNYRNPGAQSNNDKERAEKSSEYIDRPRRFFPIPNTETNWIGSSDTNR